MLNYAFQEGKLLLFNLMGSWAAGLMVIILSRQGVEEMSDTLVLLVVFSSMMQDIFKRGFGEKGISLESLLL